MMNDGKETAANENAPTGPETEPAVPESDPLAQAQAEAARLKDQLLRALAESENMRRRAEREREDTEKYAIAKFAREVLSVADNLHSALENIPADARANDELLNTLAVGVEATERELAAVFERQGIRRVDPLDEKFDPHLHQAIAEVPGTGKPAGTVVQVMRAGYVLQDRLLRPAMVAVAKDDQVPGPAPRINTMA
jgi:molecular chaperone GrpE